MVSRYLTGALLLFLSIEGLHGNSSNFSSPINITIINELRDFRPLYLGDTIDYFISNKVANIQDANKVCKSIGPNYHLVTFENENEYRKLLPYLRSLDKIQRVWTSGKKVNRTSAPYEWTQPAPSFAMDFLNFPDPTKMASLNSSLNRNDSNGDIPRCKNGFLTPKCAPIECEVSLEPCKTETPSCTIDSRKPCTVTRPNCEATCNNCTIENPTCQVIQKPCTVITKPCETIQKPCTIETPSCETTRPPCVAINPPCQVTTPKPCTTTTKRPCTTVPSCTTVQPPCSNGKCPPAVTKCKPLFKCDSDPEICYPGFVLCPAPIITCPEEITVCKPPTVICPKPDIVCPEPEVNCPPPTTVCTKPKVNCQAHEINCPGIFLNCPAPSFTCPAPIVSCPPPTVKCDDYIPCEYPDPPPPCPFDDEDDEKYFGPTTAMPLTTNEILTGRPLDCDNCQPTGCVALRKETDFKWKLEDCSEQFHFICEGTP